MTWSGTRSPPTGSTPGLGTMPEKPEARSSAPTARSSVVRRFTLPPLRLRLQGHVGNGGMNGGLMEEMTRELRRSSSSASTSARVGGQQRLLHQLRRIRGIQIAAPRAMSAWMASPSPTARVSTSASRSRDPGATTRLHEHDQRAQPACSCSRRMLVLNPA